MFDSIILIGPGTNLFPITNSYLKITNLPIINTELLLLNIKFLQPVSRKIYIVILLQDVHTITHLINLVNIPVEIIGIDYYDGVVQQLLKLEKRLKSDNLIITKGDLVSNIDINTLTDEFISKSISFLTILSHGENGALCGISNDRLIYYTRDDNYELSGDLFMKCRMTMSKEVDSLQFYILKKDLLQYATSDMFSFRSTFFPVIVKLLCKSNPVRIFNPMDNYVFQVKDINSYKKLIKFLKVKTYTGRDNIIYSKDKHNQMKQYIKKNKLEDTKNLIGNDLFIECGFIVDSVIGNKVRININSQVMSSILMNNVTIGENCFIEDCIIGSNVIIPDNTKLVHCTVSPSYVFIKSVEAEMNTFSCN